ncbi:hypothetical protein EWM62_09395 [Mucilaginibacter terrigena]|uniref:Uncharacterized protein n=1 Tax=Mucilaginibacter terrigena TaxID=2492395 RepID=A0A4Q5LNB4_9SPHI|nr:hypothetical protein [Mucilaginibacter terrigena]RYU90845.1 hypothetical protein EWM62_09395 [Mucilaginibacter terrigena]
MQTSLLPGKKKALLVTVIVLPALFLYGFKLFSTEQEWINWGNRFLNESYDPTVEPKLKKYEITLTTDHFIRLRKTYQQGKQEYYSFNLQRFAGLDYLPGKAETDTLQMKTQTDDIIIQTYQDPQGDVDSMATHWEIPVKKLSPQRLDSLKEALTFLKSKGL